MWQFPFQEEYWGHSTQEKGLNLCLLWAYILLPINWLSTGKLLLKFQDLFNWHFFVCMKSLFSFTHIPVTQLGFFDDWCISLPQHTGQCSLKVKRIVFISLIPSKRVWNILEAYYTIFNNELCIIQSSPEKQNQ